MVFFSSILLFHIYCVIAGSISIGRSVISRRAALCRANELHIVTSMRKGGRVFRGNQVLTSIR
ncbi:hypothetical protein BDW74DRAFT_163415 [Aspergillus multicolor]|uniref:uncharacterized protein n=1 Tax=Aspergillus multicolor TaxID=41759 RepID=UPI003CCD194D